MYKTVNCWLFTFILTIILRWPCEYCSITSLTSYGFLACWNFLLATKYFIFRIARIAFRWASVNLEKKQIINIKRIFNCNNNKEVSVINTLIQWQDKCTNLRALFSYFTYWVTRAGSSSISSQSGSLSCSSEGGSVMELFWLRGGCALSLLDRDGLPPAGKKEY